MRKSGNICSISLHLLLLNPEESLLLSSEVLLWERGCGDAHSEASQGRGRMDSLTGTSGTMIPEPPGLLRGSLCNDRGAVQEAILALEHLHLPFLVFSTFQVHLTSTVFKITQSDLEAVIYSEVSQKEENKYRILCPGGTSGKESTCQCRRHETQVQSLGWEDHPEKGTATHPSILAWRILWTEKLGGL